MTRQIRTVLGDIDAATAGVVDSHDHLFLSTPALPGVELDDARAAAEELAAFGRARGGTIVQWTPAGLKRGLTALQRLSVTADVHIVAATGRHRGPLYGANARLPTLSGDRLANEFITDVVHRRCGMVKVGVSSQTVTDDEMDALHAAAATHHATGVPIAVHLEQGSAFERVLQLLAADGVPVRSVVLGHIGRNPDEDQILAAAHSGAWLCLDGPSTRHPLTLARLTKLVALLIDAGHSGQILLGADTTTAGRSAPGAGPGGLICDTVPALSSAIGAAGVATIMVDNPARAWSLSVAAPTADTDVHESSPEARSIQPRIHGMS